MISFLLLLAAAAAGEKAGAGGCFYRSNAWGDSFERDHRDIYASRLPVSCFHAFVFFISSEFLGSLGIRRRFVCLRAFLPFWLVRKLVSTWVELDFTGQAWVTMLPLSSSFGLD